MASRHSPIPGPVLVMRFRLLRFRLVSGQSPLSDCAAHSAACPTWLAALQRHFTLCQYQRGTMPLAIHASSGHGTMNQSWCGGMLFCTARHTIAQCPLPPDRSTHPGVPPSTAPPMPPHGQRTPRSVLFGDSSKPVSSSSGLKWGTPPRCRWWPPGYTDSLLLFFSVPILYLNN